MKTQPRFFLPQNSEMQIKKDKLKKELLSKNKPALDNLGNSQHIQIMCFRNSAELVWETVS